MAKLNFQQPLLQCHKILQKSFKYVDFLLKKHFLLLSELEQVVLIYIFGEIVMHFVPRFVFLETCLSTIISTALR